jgi:hypothetical protein
MKYTIGEIYRQGLLKNHKGKPYKDQGTISKVLAGQPHTTKKTPFGPAKLFTKSTIDKLNARWEK